MASCCTCGGGPAGCRCVVGRPPCLQCTQCFEPFDWVLILSTFTGSVACTSLNTTWTLCQTATMCQWQVTSGTVIIQLDYLGGPATWQLKISVDSGVNFIYYTLAANLFDCNTDNDLFFDHQDAGFTCGGAPASVTIKLTIICCDDNLSSGACCCSEYPTNRSTPPFVPLLATIQRVSGGCACLDGAVVPLSYLAQDCSTVSLYAGSVPLMGCEQDAMCAVLGVQCSGGINAENACAMGLVNFNICGSNGCSVAVGALGCNTDDFCDSGGNPPPPGFPHSAGLNAWACANDVDGSQNVDCLAVPCSCSPMLLIFKNITLFYVGAGNPGSNCINDICAGVYNVIVTEAP